MDLTARYCTQTALLPALEAHALQLTHPLPLGVAPPCCRPAVPPPAVLPSVPWLVQRHGLNLTSLSKAPKAVSVSDTLVMVDVMASGESGSGWM